MSARHAVYFAPPPESRWWAFGCAWLGYDALAGQTVCQPAITGVSAAAFARLTEAPRRYGFHATLKAPMRLADGRDPGALEAALAALAAARAPFTLPALQVERLDGFLACTLAAPCAPLQALADDCVRELDPFRAPPSPAELAKRRAAGLTPLQEAMLSRWGYPHVMAAFRFHLTLTGPLADVPPELEHAVASAARQAVAELAGEPLPCDAVCLFTQATPEAAFRLVRRFPFG